MPVANLLFKDCYMSHRKNLYRVYKYNNIEILSRLRQCLKMFAEIETYISDKREIRWNTEWLLRSAKRRIYRIR